MTSPPRPGTPSRLGKFLGALGPGIVFAGAAIGISHLVQSTRAGASYGLALTLFIVLGCLVKYPAIRFGGEFAAITGRNLVQSYHQRGLWAIGTYAAVQLFSMSFQVAAVTLVNVGLFKAVLAVNQPDVIVATVLMAAVVTLLLTGGYRVFERVTVSIVALLTVLLIVATLLVIGRVDWSLASFLPPHFDLAVVAFIIALLGMMPASLDAGVLNSLWTCEKRTPGGVRQTPRESRMDFDIGYVLALLTALCFMLLGAAVMHGQGVAPRQDAAGFATQVIELFTSTIGSWAYPLISVAAVTVMFSTLLTIMDGYPRVVEAMLAIALRGQQVDPSTVRFRGVRIYSFATVGLALVVIAVLTLFMRSFTTFIDMAAILAFLVGPLLAYLNHCAIFGPEVPKEAQPGRVMRVWSMVGIGAMIVAAVGYFLLRVFS